MSAEKTILKLVLNKKNLRFKKKGKKLSYIFCEFSLNFNKCSKDFDLPYTFLKILIQTFGSRLFLSF